MSGYPTDNKEKISKALSKSLEEGIKQVNAKVRNRVASLGREISALNSKYNPVRNQLTESYRKAGRENEEYIANTGNHTASGYAQSKRMSHTDSYNRNLNGINIAQANEDAGLRDKIREAKAEGEAEIAKLRGEYAGKKLEYEMNEAARTDDLRLQYAKHNENVRLNDAQIKKLENQITLDSDKNKRENEEHGVYMQYYPERLKAENDEIKAKTENTRADTVQTQADVLLTQAKTETEKAKKLQLDKEREYTDAQIIKLKSTPVSGYKSGGSSSAGKNESVLSKMTPKDLAENILEQTGTLKYSHTGASYYENNKEKAAILLMEWRKKFNLSKQVVNDTAIHLGIQSYI